MGGTTVSFDEAISKGTAFGKSNVVSQTAVVDGGLRFISEEQKENARAKMTAIVNDNKKILGIYTDGDLRRTLDTGADIRTTIIRDVMHENCKTTSADVLAAEALHLLEENKITSLLVADDDDTLIGALNIHDLFREGLM